MFWLPIIWRQKKKLAPFFGVLVVVVVVVVVDLTPVVWGSDEPNATSCLRYVGQQLPTLVP